MFEPKGYTTREKIENYLMITIDPTFYEQIEEWIMEIEEYIDHATGRNFVADDDESPDGGGSTRRFDGDGTCKLLIDDCVEVSEVKLSVDSDPLADTDYYLYPRNAREISRPVPFTRIKLLYGVFPSYPPQEIYVTARWGYSEEVPKDIQQLATNLVGGIINFSWNSDGEVKSESIGRYSVTYNDKKQWADFEKMEEILQSYVKFEY